MGKWSKLRTGTTEERRITSITVKRILDGEDVKEALREDIANSIQCVNMSAKVVEAVRKAVEDTLQSKAIAGIEAVAEQASKLYGEKITATEAYMCLLESSYKVIGNLVSK